MRPRYHRGPCRPSSHRGSRRHDVRSHHRLGQVHAARRPVQPGPRHVRRYRPTSGSRSEPASRSAASRMCSASSSRMSRRARAGLCRAAASDLDLIVFGSCSAEKAVPNTASGLQFRSARATRRDGHQHRLHQLPVRTVGGHGHDPHGLVRNARWSSASRPSRRSWTGTTATWPCCSATARGGRAAGDRRRGRRDRGETRLLRRRPPHLARARHGTTYGNHGATSATRCGISTARKSSSARCTA